MDVKTTFLNKKPNEEVHKEIPKGFNRAGDPKKVCKFNKALYGLKQAPKAWYAQIDLRLMEHGMTRSNANPNMHYKKKDDKQVIFFMYVDDLLITRIDDKEIKRIQKALAGNFEMTDLGITKLYLGIEFEYCPSRI